MPQTVVVVFVQDGCPACHEFMPRFQRLKRQARRAPVIVHDANDPRVQALAERLDVKYTPELYVLRHPFGSVRLVGEELTDANIAWALALADYYA